MENILSNNYFIVGFQVVLTLILKKIFDSLTNINKKLTPEENVYSYVMSGLISAAVGGTVLYLVNIKIPSETVFTGQVPF